MEREGNDFLFVDRGKMEVLCFSQGRVSAGEAQTNPNPL